ncbi:MAG TPA: ABC transporter permease [Mycobacteriales bacterium]
MTAQAPSEAKEPTRPPFLRRVLDDIVHGNSVVVTILAIVIALFLGGLLIAFSDPAVLPKFGYFFAAPGDALSAAWDSVAAAYSALFKGSIVDPSDISAYINGSGTLSEVFYPICSTINQATPLILAGLAVAIPFQAGMFNIGAQGQIVVGAILAGYLGFALQLPIVLHLLVALLGGFVGGAVWGWIAGWLKARTGAHEVITTIMLNYIAASLLDFLLHKDAFQRPGRTDLVSPIVHPNARLPQLAGAALPLNAGIIVALLAAAACAWLLNRSTLGFEFKAVGANPEAARTAGMHVPRTYILVMLIAGGLAGLASTAQVLGTDYFLSIGVYSGLGFNAITVALLGRARPWGTVGAAFLFGALQAGGTTMQAATSTPVDVVTVIQALIVLFIAAPPLVRGIFRLKGARTGGEGRGLSRGWNG